MIALLALDLTSEPLNENRVWPVPRRSESGLWGPGENRILTSPVASSVEPMYGELYFHLRPTADGGDLLGEDPQI